MEHSFKKVVVSLDGINKIKAISIAKKLKGRVWGFKVNDLIYEDVHIIKELKKYGNVFVDVKLHDIPNTVSNSIQRLNKLGADIITVHASGGFEMLKSAKENSKYTKIIAVTILTSKKLKYKKEVLDLTKEAIKAKVDGLVCSGHELDQIKRLSGSKKMIKIVPGIRPLWYKEKDDQKRKITANEALRLGADLIVVGRVITKSKNILKSFENIFNDKYLG